MATKPISEMNENELRAYYRYLELKEKEAAGSSEPEFDPKSRELHESMVRNPLNAPGRTAAQAFNFSDEVMGADARLHNIFRKPENRVDPKEVAKLEQQRVAQSRSEKPLRTMGAEVAATLPLAFLSGGGTQAATWAGRAAQAGKVGAGYGVVAGAGAGDGVGDRLARGAGGGVVGGITGAAGQVGLERVANGANKFGRMVKRRGANNTVAQRRAARQVADMVDSQGVEIGTARPGMDRIYDILDGSGQARLRQAAMKSPQAKAMVEARGRDLAQSQQGNLQDAVGKTLGARADDYMKEIADAESGMRAAGKAYKAFYGDKGFPRQALDSFFDDDNFRNAANAAVKSARSREGVSFSLDDDFMSPQVVDRIKRSLDEKIRTAVRQGDQTEIGDLSALRNRFVNQVDEFYGDTYKAARSEFAGPARRRELIERGTKALKDDGDDLSAEIAHLTGDELQAVKIGIAKAIQKEAGKAKSGKFGKPGDAAARLLDTPNKEKTVRAAFGDDASFERFLGMAETQSRQLKNFDRANPATGLERPLTEAAGDMKSLATSAAIDVAGGGGVSTSANLMKRFGDMVTKSKVDPNVEREVAELLLASPEMVSELSNPLAVEMAKRAAKKRAAELMLRGAPITGAQGGRLIPQSSDQSG